MCGLGSEMCALVIIDSFCHFEEAKECPGKALYCRLRICRNTCDSTYILGICEERDSQSPLSSRGQFLGNGSNSL